MLYAENFKPLLYALLSLCKASCLSCEAGNPIKRKNMIIGRDRKMDEIIHDNKIICPVIGKYDSNVVVPLVEKTFEHNKKKYGYDTNMGLWLPSKPQDKADGRALCVDGLDGRSRLGGGVSLGDVISRPVGVVQKVAEGDAPKNYKK